VRDARMIRLPFRFLVQNRGGPELLCKGLVGEIYRPVERKGIENRCLGIIRIVLVQQLHRLLVKQRAGLVVGLVVILVKNLDRGEVFGLARRLGLRRFALLDRFPAGFEVGGREGRHQRVGQFAHRQAPISDRAARIFFDDGLKGLHRLGVKEIVQ
jgi:hypothetical protein